MEEETLPTALSLSDLPENVIDEILCRLPFKDAVSTGILSRFWHRRWESISYLDFSDSDYGENPYKIANIVVSHVLLLHTGPIRLFKAVVKRKDSFAVHGWLASLSNRAASMSGSHPFLLGFKLPFFCFDLLKLTGGHECGLRSFTAVSSSSHKRLFLLPLA